MTENYKYFVILSPSVGRLVCWLAHWSVGAECNNFLEFPRSEAFVLSYKYSQRELTFISNGR